MFTPFVLNFGCLEAKMYEVAGGILLALSILYAIFVAIPNWRRQNANIRRINELLRRQKLGKNLSGQTSPKD